MRIFCCTKIKFQIIQSYVGGKVRQKNMKYIKMNQLDKLKNDIVSTNNFEIESTIQVYPIEASVGKTKTVIEALQDSQMQVKTLLVTKLRVEQARIQQQLIDAGVTTVVYNSDNALIDTEYIINAQVLIITHEKYKRLCSDTAKAQIFTRGRSLLIIDEYIDILSYYEVGINLINDVNKILKRLPNDLPRKLYIDIVNPIKTMMDKRFNKNVGVQWIDVPLLKADIDTLVDSLIEQVKRSYIPDKEFLHTVFKNKEELKHHINSLRYYFNTSKVLIDNYYIYSANLGVKHLQGFKKTILLDASASFVELYKSKMFNVHQFDRVVDHSNTELIHAVYRTSQYAKSYRPSYIDEIEKYLESNIYQHDRAVIFGSKEDVFKLKEKVKCYGMGTDVVTFAGSRGKNDWGTYNKAFVIHTPSLKQSAYIFQYLYYFPEEARYFIGDNHAISFRMGMGGHYKFVSNKRLHGLRITDIASNMYQAVKRVDRNSQNRLENVQLHLLCSLNEVIDIVEHQLKGLKMKVVLELIERKSKASLKTDANAEIIYKVFSNIPDGKYKKSDIRARCGISDRKQWSRAEKTFIENYGLKSLEDIGVFEQGQSYVIQRNVS